METFFKAKRGVYHTQRIHISNLQWDNDILGYSEITQKLVTVLPVAWDTEKQLSDRWLTLITTELHVSETMHLNVWVSKGNEMSETTNLCFWRTESYKQACYC